MQRRSELFQKNETRKLTEPITFGLAEDGNTLKVFFGHGDGAKVLVPMKLAGVAASGVIPPMPESKLCNMIAEIVKSMCGVKTYDKIVYVGDVNIGSGGGKARGYLLDGQFEKLLAEKLAPATSPVIAKILFSGTSQIVEAAKGNLEVENTKIIVTGPEIRLRVKEAIENNDISLSMSNLKLK